MDSVTQAIRWRGGIASGKSVALRTAIAEAMEQGHAPIAWLSARSDIGFRTERVAIRDAAVASLLGADALEGRLVNSLSSGERQRVRLALALSAYGGFAGLDEPCRHLDPEHVDALNQLLRERVKQGTRLAVCDARRTLDGDLFTQELGDEREAPPTTEEPAPSRCEPLLLDIPTPFLLSYRGKPAAKQRVTIERGELVVLRGPNGSGKTSLLHVVSRTARATGARVGFSRQEPEHQVFSSTMREELRDLVLPVPRKQYGVALLHNLLLEPWMDGLATRLPLGILALFGAAVAMMNGDDLVLLDEPTQGLDLPTARRLASELVRCATSGSRLIVASHDPELVRIATTTWSVRDGSLAIGSPP